MSIQKNFISTAEKILPVTPAHHAELLVEMERASQEVTSAMRRIGSRQRYRELRLLQTAVEVARQVISSSCASPH
jgi:hypothetical protein